MSSFSASDKLHTLYFKETDANRVNKLIFRDNKTRDTVREKNNFKARLNDIIILSDSIVSNVIVQPYGIIYSEKAWKILISCPYCKELHTHPVESKADNRPKLSAVTKALCDSNKEYEINLNSKWDDEIDKLK